MSIKNQNMEEQLKEKEKTIEEKDQQIKKLQSNLKNIGVPTKRGTNRKKDQF